MSYVDLNEILKDFDLKTAKDTQMIIKTSERLNMFYVGKYCAELISWLTNEI